MSRAQPIPPEHLQQRRAPHQDRSRDALERILQSAADLLSEHGIEKLTTRHIAKRAGVNISTLYQFFPNKHAIVYSLYESWIAAAKVVFSEADQALDGTTDWRDFFMNFLVALEDVGYSAKLESRLMQAMGVFADLRKLDQDYLNWATAKIAGYILHFAPSCPSERATAMASILLEWDMALANQEIAYKGPVHDHIMKMTSDALLHLLGECIEGPHA
ncbi:TetR/AcrR family transcriptional regulator [Magnetovibrio sp.]|uniref:TetR/AcrR family transcriptional regulator n=1 Tax=Magnetovibrio sp. TaxID=2024836 RepID=UPI002F942DAF